MDQKIAHEDHFFHEENQRLIAERRRLLEEKKAQEEKELRKGVHWMKCPKCGHDMEEINLEGILVDKCTDCQGVFFDKAEVDLLYEAIGNQGFLGRIMSIFK